MAQVSLLKERCQYSSSPPSLNELSRILSELVKIGMNTYLIFDALDEFEDRRTLIPILQRLSKDGVKALVTSRNVPDIRNSFETEKSIEVRASRHDLKIYVEGRLAESDHLSALSPSAGIIPIIIDQAGGM